MSWLVPQEGEHLLLELSEDLCSNKPQDLKYKDNCGNKKKLLRLAKQVIKNEIKYLQREK